MKERMEFLEKSISFLCEEEFTLVTAIYFDGVSVAKIAKSKCYSRQNLYYRLDKIIEKLAKTYHFQFGSAKVENVVDTFLSII